MTSKSHTTTDHLAFLYQEQKSSGEDSTFFKLVSR